VSVTPLPRGPEDEQRERAERPPRRSAPPAPGRAPSLLDSFNYAFEGIIHVLRTQRNLRIHFLAAVLVFGAAIAVGVSRIQLIALVLAIAFVLVAEMLNTAIEGVIDVSTTSFDPNAKLAKDIAAGAVLIASVTAIAVGFLVFQSAVGGRATRVLDRVRDAPADITLVALVLVVLLVIATKAWTGRGTPLRGGLPSGHAALAFAGWVAVTYLISDQHRFVVSAVVLIMALLVAQTRIESGIHSSLEVAYGGALGALTTLVVFQLIG
jgi:diacylglycerol kinase (ATP)